MKHRKIFLLATIIIIGTIAFVGCKKTNNDNSLNKEKAKVEDNDNKDTQKEDTQNKKTQEESKIDDAEVEKVGEAGTELGKKASESELKDFNAVATIDPQMFGSNVTVTCYDSEIATYKIFTEIGGKMEALHNDKVAIGEVATELFPAEEGQKVIIKFFDADDVLLGESATTLVL